MRTPRLLVTGGAGFIGSHVVEAALGAGYDVAILDRDITPMTQATWLNVHLFQGDLRDAKTVWDAALDFKPDYVSHHAALIDAVGSCANPRECFETNVMGSVNLFDACDRVGTVRRIVFASSAAVYGDVTLPSASEERDLPSPETPYGAGKLAVEQLFTAMYPHTGIECVSLRYPNVYGPRSRHGVVAKFIQAALAGEDLRVQLAAPDCGWSPQLGTQRQYVFVEDVARANIRALGTHVIGCSVYNVPGAFRSTWGLAGSIINRVGSGRVVEAPHVQGDVSRSFMVYGRFLEEIMGQRDLTSLSSGLDRTIAWWKDAGRQPKG